MNGNRTRRAAICVRVSTGSQTTKHQLRELRQVAERHGWTVTAEFSDNGISGSKGGDQRPGLEAVMQAVGAPRRFDELGSPKSISFR
jgi:DNA invertase Pin-like site-specific DNA recombinase